MSGRAVSILAAAVIATALSSFASAQTAPSTTSQPTTTSQPATTQASADVSPAAEVLLNKLAAAYANAGPMVVAGTIAGDFDVAGRRKTYSLEISGRTDGNGHFFHYARGAGLVVSDGTNGYLYDERHNAYAELQVTKNRPAPGELDPAISDVLIDENPALLLTLTSDPAALLRQLAKAIRLPAGGKSALVLELPTKLITFDIDAKTSQIARSTIDYTPLMKARNATGVKSAQAVLTYTQQIVSSKTPPDSLTWAPPATARQITLHNELLRSPVQGIMPPKPPQKITAP